MVFLEGTFGDLRQQFLPGFLKGRARQVECFG
jgi:hypothetical protein